MMYLFISFTLLFYFLLIGITTRVECGWPNRVYVWKVGLKSELITEEGCKKSQANKKKICILVICSCHTFYTMDA